MASNFESKHPRAKDGKFTEKTRKESGSTLELGDHARENEADDLERGEISIGEPLHRIEILDNRYATVYEHEDHDEIPLGQWQLSQKIKMEDGSTELTYHHKEGIVVETFDKDGHIEKQVFERSNYERIQDANKWTEKNWNKDGVLVSRTRDFSPKLRNEETFKPVSKAVDKAGGSLVVSEYFSDSGVLDERQTWFKNDGQLYQTNENYDKNGNLYHRYIRNFYNEVCAPENMPSYLTNINGKIFAAEYVTERGGKIVYHRTDGPAIFQKYGRAISVKRYFLDGKEYTKAEWEEKVGRS